MCIPPCSQAPRCASYRRVKCTLYSTNFLKKLCGVQLCIPPRSQVPWCASYRGVKLCGVHTFESKWKSLVAYKGTIGRIPFRGKLFLVFILSCKKRFEEKMFELLRLKFWLCGVMHIPELNFSNFVIKYHGEIKTEFENILACLSGA